jgi:hypothetical protein
MTQLQETLHYTYTTRTVTFYFQAGYAHFGITYAGCIITTPGCAGCTFRLKQQHLQHHAHATMLRATATMQPMTIPAMTPASKVVVSVVHVN